jgi:hypothetical protein
MFSVCDAIERPQKKKKKKNKGNKREREREKSMCAKQNNSVKGKNTFITRTISWIIVEVSLTSPSTRQT